MIWIIIYILLLPYFRIGGVTRLNFSGLFLLLCFRFFRGGFTFNYGEQKEKRACSTHLQEAHFRCDAVTRVQAYKLKPRLDVTRSSINFQVAPVFGKGTCRSVACNCISKKDSIAMLSAFSPLIIMEFYCRVGRRFWFRDGEWTQKMTANLLAMTVTGFLFLLHRQETSVPHAIQREQE